MEAGAAFCTRVIERLDEQTRIIVGPAVVSIVDPTQAGAVDSVGEEFLVDAGFADQQHGTVGGRNGMDAGAAIQTRGVNVRLHVIVGRLPETRPTTDEPPRWTRDLAFIL